MSTESRSDRDHLRHTVATLAYRGGKVVRDAPENFARFTIGETSRTPAQILAHIADLLDWAVSLAAGAQVWQESIPASWEQDVDRFFAGVARLDEYLASEQRLHCSAEALFQGPVADALTHVGQLAMLRRLAGSPVRGENYFKADIRIGRVGPDQPPPRRAFD